MLLEEKFIVKAPAQKIWDFIINPELIGPCVPGLEKIDVLDENTYESVVKIKVGFIKVKMKTKTVITEKDVPRHMKTVSDGQDALKAGEVHQEMTVDIKEISDSECELSYSANVRITGKLATFGEKIMRSTTKKLSAQFVKNLREKLEE
jgi:carbon monoxide dehydrogenase subunit G